MRLLMFSLSAGIAITAPAFASSQNCTRAGDVRTVEVVTPGVIGAACDLKYIRENGNNISVPYHADYSASFCVERATALVSSLVAAGYTCTETTAVAPLREVNAAPQTPPVEVAAAQPAPEPAESYADNSAAPSEGAASEFIPEPPVAQSDYPDAPIVAEAPIEEPASSFEPTVLEQPPVADRDALASAETGAIVDENDAPAFASRGPTALSTTFASAPATTKAPRSSVVGRLVGAAPDATPIAQTAVATSEERLAPNAKPVPEVPSTAAATTTLASAATPVSGGRPAADIIRGVLMAQAAAWNEGDLEAFMGGYWKSPDVRFVSGTNVTKGWQQTLKRYRERYGQSSSLGRLSFDGLDIQVVTDDVAVIVGRFNLASGAATETGAFTLVMKRFDGLWRIVHDHSVGDPAPTPQ